MRGIRADSVAALNGGRRQGGTSGGYGRSDEIIRLLARTGASLCDPRNDFVGHVGGDDFLQLMQSAGWKDRDRDIIRQFDSDAVPAHAASPAVGLQALFVGRGGHRHGPPNFLLAREQRLAILAGQARSQGRIACP